MGNNSEEAQGNALQNGCEELHPKPVDFGRLLQQIDAATEPEAEATELASEN